MQVSHCWPCQMLKGDPLKCFAAFRRRCIKQLAKWQLDRAKDSQIERGTPQGNVSLHQWKRNPKNADGKKIRAKAGVCVCVCAL